MLVYARWKYVLILFVLLLSAVYALPNIYPQDPSVQVTANRGSTVDAALKARIEGTLKKIGVSPKELEISKDGNLLVRLRDPNVQIKAADAIRDELGSDFVVALNLASTVPDWLQKIGARPMLLGLDLQGGVHFLMQVDQQAALAKRFEATAEDVRVLLRENRVAYTAVERRPDNSIVATLASNADPAKARELIAKNLPTLQIGDSEVANQVVVRIPQADLDRVSTEAIEQNVSTLRNRINELGVAEPIIQRQGNDRVVVQLPGVQDTAQAKRILGATATLEFRGVYEGGDLQDAVTTGNVPGDARLFFTRGGPNRPASPVLLKKRVIVSGDQLVGAQSTRSPDDGSPAVSIQLNSQGGQRMFDYSSENVGKGLAVVYIERIPEVKLVDGKEVRTTRVKEEVISIANIREPLGKSFQTSGLDSPQDAADLALLLRAGALAAPMEFIDERTVGPSLGAENVQRGLTAVLFSFGFALVFFLVYYRMFGVITCIALLINLLMVVAVMSVLGATLTLPGLAGIALTVGMSVDANVLINERIREELRLGMPPLGAIKEGYERAAGTIADANITAILAGVALFAFGTGPVKGFAVSLIVGILTSMYTAVSVSRGIATLIYGHRRKLKSIAV
ncbi:protein translocase subunit SecD [Lysobacter sp. A6]|uniref:Protein translocase subunit SecD n=1 Tax=Noviluteimonas lactosilytica TaxID=2888523 RepID=A0ABS8JLL4_9GAMM|nr:protein translocase subunit SecD [Lysobacter lactosilyticus]MCC8364525.1 protein translocase subunit SecD [Lysobacter lactosilyticus]